MGKVLSRPARDLSASDNDASLLEALTSCFQFSFRLDASLEPPPSADTSHHGQQAEDGVSPSGLERRSWEWMEMARPTRSASVILQPQPVRITPPHFLAAGHLSGPEYGTLNCTTCDHSDAASQVTSGHDGDAATPNGTALGSSPLLSGNSPGVSSIVQFYLEVQALRATLLAQSVGIEDEDEAGPHLDVAADEAATASLPSKAEASQGDEGTEDDEETGTETETGSETDSSEICSSGSESGSDDSESGSDETDTDSGSGSSSSASADDEDLPPLSVNNLQEALTLHRSIIAGRLGRRRIATGDWTTCDATSRAIDHHQFNGFRPALASKLRQLGLGQQLADMEALLIAEDMDFDPSFSYDDEDDELDYLAGNSGTSRHDIAVAARLITQYHSFMVPYWATVGPSEVGPVIDDAEGKDNMTSEAYDEFVTETTAARKVFREERVAQEFDSLYEVVEDDAIIPIEGSGRHDREAMESAEDNGIVRPDEHSDDGHYQTMESDRESDGGESSSSQYSAIIGVDDVRAHFSFRFDPVAQ